MQVGSRNMADNDLGSMQERVDRGLSKHRSWTGAIDLSGDVAFAHPTNDPSMPPPRAIPQLPRRPSDLSDHRNLLKGMNQSHSRSSPSLVAEEDIALIGKKMIATNLSDPISEALPQASKPKASTFRRKTAKIIDRPLGHQSAENGAVLNKRDRPKSNYELLKNDERNRDRARTDRPSNNVKFSHDLEDLIATTVDEVDDDEEDDENLQGYSERLGNLEEDDEDEDDEDEEEDEALDKAAGSDDDTPTIVKRWTPEQDEALRQAVSEYGERHWKAIAARVPGRNHAQCLQRWRKVLKPGLVKGHWSFEEDSILERMVRRGCHSWGQVAAAIPGRTPKQCRERWRNHLDPSINKGPFTPEEDAIIIEAQEKLGNRWSHIAQLLPGRTEDAVKIRWKSMNIKPAKKSKPGRPRLVPGLATSNKNKGPPQPGEIGVIPTPPNLPPELARLVEINNAKQAARIAAQEQRYREEHDLNSPFSGASSVDVGKLNLDQTPSATPQHSQEATRTAVQPKFELPNNTLSLSSYAASLANSREPSGSPLNANPSWLHATQPQQPATTLNPMWAAALNIATYDPFLQQQAQHLQQSQQHTQHTQQHLQPAQHLQQVPHAQPTNLQPDLLTLQQLYGLAPFPDPTSHSLTSGNVLGHESIFQPMGNVNSGHMMLNPLPYTPQSSTTDEQKSRNSFGFGRSADAELELFLSNATRESKSNELEELVLGHSLRNVGDTDPRSNTFQYSMH